MNRKFAEEKLNSQQVQTRCSASRIPGKVQVKQRGTDPRPSGQQTLSNVAGPPVGQVRRKQWEEKLSYLRAGMHSGSQLWKIIWEYLRKLKRMHPST